LKIDADEKFSRRQFIWREMLRCLFADDVPNKFVKCSLNICFKTRVTPSHR